MDDNKTIIPPGPCEHHRQQKLARRQHIKQTLQWLSESDDLFLDNSITHAKEEHTAITKNDTNNAKHVAINSAHAQHDQLPSSLPNVAKIQPSAWVPHSIEP
jgi:hypothetical protein